MFQEAMSLFSNHMHLPKQVDMQDRVADFWKDEASLANPRKHTLQPIVTGKDLIN